MPGDDYSYVTEDCEKVRRLIGRGLDDDASESQRAVVDIHLINCEPCAHWRQQAVFLQRTVAAGSASPPADLGETLMLATRRSHRRRSRVVGAIRIALLCVALLGIALAAPALALGNDDGLQMHASHEIGSIEVALCIGLLGAAVWPHRARGILTVVATAAALLFITAGSDIAAGYTTAAHEADHLVVVGGAALMWWLSRLVPEIAPPLRRPAVGFEHSEQSQPLRTGEADIRTDEEVA